MFSTCNYTTVQAFFAASLEETALEMEQFGEEVVDRVFSACSTALQALDKTLFSVRDGVVADEAAEKHTQMRKCAPPASALRTVKPGHCCCPAAGVSV